jgi:hypothetical protein
LSESKTHNRQKNEKDGGFSPAPSAVFIKQFGSYPQHPENNDLERTDSLINIKHGQLPRQPT